MPCPRGLSLLGVAPRESPDASAKAPCRCSSWTKRSAAFRFCPEKCQKFISASGSRCVAKLGSERRIQISLSNTTIVLTQIPLKPEAFRWAQESSRTLVRGVQRQYLFLFNFESGRVGVGCQYDLESSKTHARGPWLSRRFLIVNQIGYIGNETLDRSHQND